MYGLYARDAIEPGELVWISFLYPEDCVFYSWADIERRRELIRYAYQIDRDVFLHSKNVDADISNFINHSCEANAWYDHSVEAKERFVREYIVPKVGPIARELHEAIVSDPLIEYVVACRPIAKGEEIVMDYSSFWNISDLEFECRCGSAQCRSIIKQDHYRRMDPHHCSIHIRRVLLGE